MQLYNQLEEVVYNEKSFYKFVVGASMQEWGRPARVNTESENLDEENEMRIETVSLDSCLQHASSMEVCFFRSEKAVDGRGNHQTARPMLKLITS